MQVELTEKQAMAMRRWIDEGEFSSPTEVLDEAFRLLGKRVGPSELGDLLQEGLDSPVAEWREADLDDIRASIRKRLGT
ncbi:MAG: hypothetical protein JNK37_07970 [Verrucomicrobiales bacterium]|nr:hypothetical protein [Verrucomicrobiales bacterium]